MKIHEYQAKELFRKYDVPVPQGQVAYTPDEAAAAADTLGGYPVVVKAQIHAGGRGKGGGVKLAQSQDEVKSLAGEIIGMNLVTHQTGPEGRTVGRVLLLPDRLSAAASRLSGWRVRSDTARRSAVRLSWESVAEALAAADVPSAVRDPVLSARFAVRDSARSPKA